MESSVDNVFQNSELTLRILSFLSFETRKNCREVCTKWRDKVTDLLRSKTRVCVNDISLDVILSSKGKDPLGLNLHIRSGPYIRLGLRRLIQDYSLHIKSLSWFVDNSGVDVCEETGTIFKWDIQDLKFPCLTELYVMFCSAISDPELYYIQYKLVLDLMKNCPKLEEFRLEILHDIRVTDILISLQNSFTKLRSIRFGKNVKLRSNDFILLKAFEPPLKSFIWDNTFRGLDEEPIYPKGFNGDWLNSLEVLKLPRMVRSGTRSLRNLRSLSIESWTLTTSLSKHFPNLEEFSFSFEPGFDWEKWMLANKYPHPKIKCLTWQGRRILGENEKNCLTLLFTKFPHLDSLTCPADDHFLSVIFEKLPRLKKLVLNGNCSDVGITGLLIPSLYYDKDEFLIDSFKTQHSILDLQELEELTIMHTKITNTSVFNGIDKLMKLKKLYITGVTPVGLIRLLFLPSLVELGVPQPLEGSISFEDIELLKSISSQIKIVVGWDAFDFQPCYCSNHC